MKGSIYVDLTRCLACKACEFGCAVEHSASKDMVEAIHEDPPPVPRVRLEQVEGTAIPLQCRHCEDAPCVAICPTGAIEKLGPEQAVIIHEDKCIGCKFCVAVCPFGVVTLRKDGRVALKCDLCLLRTEEGLLPACVTACPTGAMKFLTAEELAKEKRRETAAKEYEATRPVRIKVQGEDG